jgi:uncharacterized membrane protein HdeD (DUF308 family)
VLVDGIITLLGVASLTLVLASLFLIEGILLLGLMIYLQWPLSSGWALGTLVSVSMIISGVTRVMLSFAVRKTTGAVA